MVACVGRMVGPLLVVEISARWCWRIGGILALSILRRSRRARARRSHTIRSLLALNGSPNRFRQLVELGLELRTGLQNLREFCRLCPQGIDWFQ
jgi:hypothetical protein